MKIMRKLILYCILLLSGLCNAQIDPNTINNLSPDGVLDNVFDHYGNKYNLSDIVIGKEVRDEKGKLLRSTNPTPMSCGYFDLYFESDCGMDNASIQAHLDRRAVVCRVFNDISNFIPLPQNSNVRVNIWVRNINNVIVAPNSPNGVLGLASSFYSVPNNSTTGFGGIVDSEVWKTIHTGTNSYTNLASPLITFGLNTGPSGIFYHGMMAFNFNTTNTPTINWNTNMGIATPIGTYDLYSVVLHEITHALGFVSLIDQNGSSRLGAGFNYYTRYDLFLKNNNNSQFLIRNPSACSPMYNYSFNTANLSNTVLRPGCTLPNNTNSGTSVGTTVCANALRFVGSTNNVPIYTPICYEPGSSFSHFEDMCIGSPNQNNTNNYFVMTDASGTGQTKRFLKPEERNVLCDIGYNVNSTFGDASTFNGTINYGGSACSGITVAGVNDGINPNGTYTFIDNAGANIQISGILSNDRNATSFECVQDIYSTSTITVVSGVINFTSNVAGLHLLRYVPVNGTQRGNITYIYVYVRDSNCLPSSCNLVSNGGFENSTLCGLFGVGSNPPTASCWNVLSQTPDLYKRNCTNTSGVFNLGINTYQNTPPADSHDGIPNNNIIGLFFRAADHVEGLQNSLGSPLVQNQQYILSFWARVNNGYTLSNNIPIPLNFSSYPNLIAPTSLVGQNFQNVVPNSVQLVPTTLVPNDSSWHFYSYLFTFSENLNHNSLAVYTGSNINASQSYIYVDDISIISTSQGSSLNLPPSICLNQTISNLASYLSATPTTGVFSGPPGSISLSGTTYTFNSTAAGLGTHTIIYTYNNNIGCSVTISSTITVSACSPTSCPGNLVFNSTELASNATYQAANTITTNTNYLVNAGSTITLVAGNSITFSPSSEVKANSSSDFTARIGPCTQTSARVSEEEIESFLEEEKITLFPNPTKESITISAKVNNLKKLTVYAIDGKMVFNHDIEEANSFQLDVSNYQNGIYIAIIETDDGTIFKEKIIKN